MERSHVPDQYSDTTSELLHSAMENVHMEVCHAEKKIEAGFRVMWKEVLDMLEHQHDASKTNISSKDADISVLKNRVAELEQKQTYLLQENVQLHSQLKDTQKNLNEVMEELKVSEQRLDKEQEERKIITVQCNREHELEVSKHKSTIQELSTSLKEYQSKFTSMTSKMKLLSEKMIMEKTSSDKAKKAFSSQLSNQTAETKKATLEVSQLKTDIANSNKALAIARQNIKKLQGQLQEAKSSSELTIMELQKQQSTQLKMLNEEIYHLQLEIQELKRRHCEEIEQIKTRNKDSERDDFLEARISFLQHQNRREKGKIQEKIT